MNPHRRARFLSLAAACAALLLAACGSDDDSSGAADPTTSSLKAPASLVTAGSLKVCADLSFPPMTYQDAGGKPAGFDVDTARAVAELWNVELATQNTPFDGVLPALSSGRCDLAWTGINVTDERLQTFDAVPYLDTGLVLLVGADNPEGISSPEQLASKTAATQSGTIYEKSLKALAKDLEAKGESAPRVQTYPKMTDAIQQLVVGRADAVLTQDTEAAYRGEQQPGAFEVAYTYPEKDRFGVYFKKGNAEMQSGLTTALSELQDSGELARIAESNGLSPENLLIK